MTTTISSGEAVSYTTGITIGQSVEIEGTGVKGRVTYMSFGRRSLRACVQYTDGQERVQEEWQDVEDLKPASP